MTELISRNDARERGQTRYFTGEPCPYGHIATRFVSNNRCSTCQRQDEKDRGTKNPDAYRAKARRSYKRNASSRKLGVKKWQDKNADKVRAYKRKWNAEHKEEKLAMTRNRRAIKRTADGIHTAEDVLLIQRLQKNRCAYCRVKLKTVRRHVDHIHPLIKGGANHRKNIQVLCQRCNNRKGTKDPHVFAQELGMLL